MTTLQARYGGDTLLSQNDLDGFQNHTAWLVNHAIGLVRDHAITPASKRVETPGKKRVQILSTAQPQQGRGTIL
jgi:hypothetical protein